jgi:hypothetical protein
LANLTGVILLPTLLTPAIKLAKPAQIGDEALDPDPHFFLRAFSLALTLGKRGHLKRHLSLGFLQAALNSLPKKNLREGLRTKANRVFISAALDLKKFVWVLCLCAHSTPLGPSKGSKIETTLPKRMLAKRLSFFLKPGLRLETAARVVEWDILV